MKTKNSNYTSLLLIIILFSLGCSKKEVPVKWVSTTNSERWENSVLSLEEAQNEKNESIVQIYPTQLQQKIDGFGGCFNELGWEALQKLAEKDQESIMKSLFDTIGGCKFNICRMPIGANDYAVDWYSHNETEEDFEMKNFSIQRDKKRLIPYIKEAKKINPNTRIWASPWCPPSWMKTNNHYACRPDKVNDLNEEGKGEEMITQFKMNEKYLDAYALYFSKFIDAYKKEGIDIYAIHVQNEPNSCQNFPSCIWKPEDLSTFIGNHLGPWFKENELNTEIWLGTIERPHPARIDKILQNPTAQKYIEGVGFQWAGKEAIPHVNKNYPDLKLMQTETECGNGSNDWKAAEYTFNLMKHYFNNGANSYLYWNMILNETGKSQWGWKQNSMITINSETKEINYNPEFYLMKHFSHFIKPGSHKIKSSDSDCLAFKNSDSLVFIYYNSGNETNKTFLIEGKKISVTLPEKSFNTFELDLN